MGLYQNVRSILDLEPPPHTGFIAGVHVPKLFLKIGLLVLDDQTVHKVYEHRYKNQSPICAAIERDANQHEQKTHIDRVTSEAINARSDNAGYTAMRIDCSSRFPEFKKRGDAKQKAYDNYPEADVSQNTRN